MIRVEGAQPSADEVAAIAAALAAALGAPAAEARAPRSPWQLANRQPDLDRDDIRAAVRTAP